MHDVDPTSATSPAFNRRAFVGMSAGVAGLVAAGGAALAEGEGFGAPHPPIVPEKDPAIATSHTQVRYAGRSIDAYYAAPANAGRQTPGVVIVQAAWGVDAQLRDVARRVAKAGYIAIAPDLYSGLGAPNGDGVSDYAQFRPSMAKLVDATVDADLAACADFIRSGSAGKPEKVGVMGFGLGGAITLRQAVDGASKFEAVSVFYGKVRYGTGGNEGPITPIALAYADELVVPLCGSWGERDTSILPDDVRALDAKLTSLKRPHDVKLYDEAGHAFFDDTRSSYVASAASDAWSRTMGWFARYLTS